jgi:hypothetical protein
MDFGSAGARACPIGRVTARAAGCAPLLAVFFVFSSAALGQTLTEPGPPAKWSPPPVTAKAQPDRRAKSCRAYGAGFVNVPGTDACVKVGGWVTIEGSMNR